MPAVEPMPAAAPVAAEPRPRPTRDPIPPRWVRFLLWIVAIPVAFIVVLVFARAAGMLTTNEISDVALAQGWSRFWPIARLIPFVALAAAGLVQGGALLLTRMRQRRWAEQQREAALKAAGRANPRTNGARPRNQSSRTRA
jgi:TRAP-type C4-dicarboxylate transport system permease small subunit